MSAPRRRVVEWEAQGCGIFKYTLSCGHITSRVGRIPRGIAMERAAKTCKCYECGKEQQPTSHGAGVSE